MKQNIYDNPEFFEGYRTIRDNGSCLNEVLEQPAMRSLLPDVSGMRVLDLGCGAGNLCRELHALGASSVTGVDISARMLELAQLSPCEGVAYVQSSMEDFTTEPGSFDLVASSLAFHYVQDYDGLVSRIGTWLAEGGYLVFSMEHPVATAPQEIHPGWARDAEGRKQCWMLDCYRDEGERQSRWFVDGVIKYHRTTETVINTLIDSGFTIRRILEPHALESAEAQCPGLLDERRRPPFLLVKAQFAA